MTLSRQNIAHVTRQTEPGKTLLDKTKLLAEYYTKETLGLMLNSCSLTFAAIESFLVILRKMLQGKTEL